jgi:hypothetical protein
MTATDAALMALGERFERRLLEYMDAWLAWAPLMRAARAEAESDLAGFSIVIQRNGCEAAQARMSELEHDMQPLAEEIIAAPAERRPSQSHFRRPAHQMAIQTRSLNERDGSLEDGSREPSVECLQKARAHQPTRASTWASGGNSSMTASNAMITICVRVSVSSELGSPISSPRAALPCIDARVSQSH